jgi:hypothetical protein
MHGFAVGWALLAVLNLARPAFAVEATPVPPRPPDSLDDIPSAKPQDVARVLRKVRQRHGEDAVVVQTHLLLNAMQKGAVLATGVRVDRVEEARGKRFLRFVLETGFVFDDSTRDRVQRAQILWATIMEPTLARLEDGLQVEHADGMVVQMQYFHRPYRTADELRTHIDEPGTAEEAQFYVASADLDDVVRGKRQLRDLLSRVRTTIDGADLVITPPATGATLTPGPE